MGGDKSAFSDKTKADATGLRFAVITARFNREITDQLQDAALRTLVDAGAAERDIAVFEVPGCFEIPIVAKRLATSGRFDAIIALGAVIRGETPHFEYVANEAAAGVARVAYDTGVPVSFGILTTDTLKQAAARAGGPRGNKGAEAALTAVELARLLKSI
ncbi:MAG: 6,7-dimethyl-8-ribityllumazine synthase [Actinomycetota bacterium]